jgi:peptidoglycan-N-acetylglucosamine deacetylase
MKLSLTFDAEHPDQPCLRGNVDAVLNALADAHVSAMFFVQGAWASSHPHTVRRMARDGHTVANHSWSHARMTRLTPDGMAQEITSTAELLSGLTEGRYSALLRPPYGDGLRSEALRTVAADCGHAVIGWDFDSGDWKPGTTADELLARVLGAAHTGGMVVFHSWPDCTAEALPAILEAVPA